MPSWLKQSTAATVELGPFVDDTDFKTVETALTIAQADIRLSKNGGAFAQSNNVAGATHLEGGDYGVPLDTTDTNTLGRLRVRIAEAGALVVWRDFMVVPANVWDSFFGADKLQVDLAEWLGTAAATPTVAGVPEVDVTHLGGDATSGADLKDFVDAGYDPATNKVQGVVLVDTLTTYTGNTPQTGDAFARLGAPAGASVSADIAAIEAQTDDIGAAGAGLTAVPWNAAWDAEVQSEVDDALVAQRLDEVLNADSDIDGLAPPAVGSVVHELLSKTAGSFTYDQTTDSLEAIRDKATDLETDTQDLQARVPAALVGGRIDASVGAMAANVVTAAATAADFLAEVNAEVVDALATDTYAEPGQEAPAATASLATKISYLCKAWRNRFTQSATEYKLYGDDATTVHQKATVSDDGTTFDRAEVGTGP